MYKEVVTYDLSELKNDDAKMVYLAIELLKIKHDVILTADEMIEFLGINYERFNKAVSDLVVRDMMVYDTRRQKYDTVPVSLN